jgi:hypothetical protein
LEVGFASAAVSSTIKVPGAPSLKSFNVKGKIQVRLLGIGAESMLIQTDKLRAFNSLHPAKTLESAAVSANIFSD